MRPYTNASCCADLVRVQIRRDVANELRTDPHWQRAGLGARNDRAEQIVRAAFDQQEEHRNG